MNSNWPEVFLRDICSHVEYGYTASASQELIGPKFLRITDIVPDLINWESVPYCQIEKKKLTKYLLHDGDIVVARTGATTGYAKRLKNPPPSVFASYLIRLKTKIGVDSSFIGSIVESNHYKQFIMRNIGGAAQPNANAQVLTSYKFKLPPLPIQRRIASILSAYDDLIENNTRRIAILEEMARRIYEEWFVKFKFPGHEKVKMVDSELGKIPEGWEVGYLSDILESIRYATRPGDHLSNRRYVPIDCIARKSLVLPEFKPWEEAQSSLVLFEEDDILFGAMRPYFHKVCIAPFPGITRTTCFVLRARDYYAHAFGVLTAFADATVSYASAHTQGATIPYAVWDGSLADYKVLIPTIELLKIFEETVSPMLNWLKRVTFKQTNLRTTRDFLLPKLISGEIDVSQLPEPEEAAA